MPLKHLRVCEHYGDRFRFAGRSATCRVPPDDDRDSWLENLQAGAGTLGADLSHREPLPGGTYHRKDSDGSVD
jgi:hypothetical protein